MSEGWLVKLGYVVEVTARMDRWVNKSEAKVGVAKGGIVKCGKSEGRLGQGRQVL